MIRSVYSDLPKFKAVSFKPGFNVLLAAKGPGATDRQTRNRAGKSSLLEIIHFLLGGRCDKDAIFKSEALRDTVFGMEFDLAARFTRVERFGARTSPVTIEGDFTDWPLTPSAKDGRHFISSDNWKLVLGKMMFGLDDSPVRWSPSFRSLISYFIRRDRSGGMAKAMAQATRQQLVDQQVNISFLVGLDWTVPHAWQKVREREKQLEELRKSLGEGAFGTVIGSASSLKSELVVARDRVRRLRDSLADFRVVEEYHELEREASSLTRKIASLGDDDALDRRYLAELEQTVSHEATPAPGDVEAMYKEAGIVLPELVKKRFDDVQGFHESVVRNRRAYLLGEIQATKQRMADRAKEMEVMDLRRSELMNALKSAGALEHFTALQSELSRVEADAEATRQKYETAEALESGTLRLKAERNRLIERLKRDYADEESVIDEAILTFRRISSALYEDQAAGSLTITPTENGPEFDPRIPGAKSKGVNNMQIFCFDMMLMLLSLKRGRSPGFLVHDSHLFDGVDERQKGKALALGKQLAERHGFQYIVTMNSDDVPREVPAGFDLECNVLPVRLTDATEDGGLFGFRFD